jgi:hypothetical protein
MDSETNNPCPNSVRECNFPSAELTQLHILATKTEYIGFPRWALGVLISVLSVLLASTGALWLKVETRASTVALESTRQALIEEIVRTRTRVEVLENVVPKEYPPVWFQKQFDSLVTQSKLLTDQMTEVRIITARNQIILESLQKGAEGARTKP